MKKIKLILFDIDNTLVYGERALLYYKQYPSLLEKTLSKCLSVSLQEAVEITNDHRARFNGRGEKSFETYKTDTSLWYDAICTLKPNQYVAALPHVQELLLELKSRDYLLGAITDGPTTQAERILKTAKIDKNLFSIFIGWEREGRMPKGGSTQVYQKIISESKLHPSEILMVGDSIDADIIPAHQCGINVLYISDKPDNRFPTVSSVAQLLNYLNEYEENKK